MADTVYDDLRELKRWLEQSTFMRNEPHHKDRMHILERLQNGMGSVAAQVRAKLITVAELEIQAFGARLVELHARGWAPGAYLFTCKFCEQTKTGDKRCIRCLSCAVGQDRETENA